MRNSITACADIYGKLTPMAPQALVIIAFPAFGFIEQDDRDIAPFQPSGTNSSHPSIAREYSTLSA